MILHRSWICELAELESITSKKMAGEIKSFLSQNKMFLEFLMAKLLRSFLEEELLSALQTDMMDFLLMKQEIDAFGSSD